MQAKLQSGSPSPRRSAPRPPVRRRRRVTLNRRLAKHTAVLEVSARLAVNGLLVLTSFSALGQLVPYIHHQTQRLDQVNQAVDSATTSQAKVRTEFGRYFDPAQSHRLIQEYSGYKSPQERQIVWTDPTHQP